MEKFVFADSIIRRDAVISISFQANELDGNLDIDATMHIDGGITLFDTITSIPIEKINESGDDKEMVDMAVHTSAAMFLAYVFGDIEAWDNDDSEKIDEYLKNAAKMLMNVMKTINQIRRKR